MGRGDGFLKTTGGVTEHAMPAGCGCAVVWRADGGTRPSTMRWRRPPGALVRAKWKDRGASFLRRVLRRKAPQGLAHFEGPSGPPKALKTGVGLAKIEDKEEARSWEIR